MSLHDAIMALSPNHYWTFATNPGDLVCPDVVGTMTMTTAVNDGGGAVGPELSTTANRIYADQAWQTPSFNANAFVNQTWMMLFTIPANGQPSTISDILGWGDPTNHATRGWRLQQQSSSNNAAGLTFRGTANAITQAMANYNIGVWHLLAWYYQPSPIQMAISLDGAAFTTGTGSLGTAYQNTDRIWIQSAYPIVIAHIASFPSILTQAQVQTVSNQVQAWPYQLPINMPVQGGGEVTISPTDTVTQQLLSNQQTFMPQVTDIQGKTTSIQTTTNLTQTDTHNMVNTLFPQLANELNAIMSAVTATITGVGGAISKTIGSLFSGSALDQLSPENLGTACAPSVINVSFGVSVRYGLQMQCTSYADWYVFTGNADDYTTQALGTLQIFRGGNEVLRHGLHTLTHTVYPLPGVPVLPVNVGIELVPNDYQVILTPAPETCWHLEALVQP